MEGSQAWGGAKVKKHPCHCCGIQSKDMIAVGPQPCSRWCVPHAPIEGNPPPACYHHEIVTDDILETMGTKAQELEEALETAFRYSLIDQKHTVLRAGVMIRSN